MSQLKSLDQFLNWYSSLKFFNAAKKMKNDVVLNHFGSRRFVLGVITKGEDAGKPILGIHYADVKSVNSIPWKRAGIVCGHQNSDWLALSCDDIRVENAETQTPVPLRLWIQFPIGSMDPWTKHPPKTIELRRAKNDARGKAVLDKSPMHLLPLSIKNKWEEV